MAIAFFDLDRTLIKANSGTLWFKRQVLEGRMSKADTARAVFGLAKYSLGYVAIDEMVRTAVSRLRGQSESALRERVYRFYDEEVHSRYRPGGLRAVERHRAAGDQLVLLTSASLYLSERVQETLELDAILCNRFETDGDILTGRSEGALCYREGKLVHARAFAGDALSDAWFYTDSTADLSVLEVVAHPIAVHPDRRLKRLARSKDWPIEDWSE